MSVCTYHNWTADQYRLVKLQLQLILLLCCVSDRLEMYINISPYLLKLNCWPVPTSKLQLQLTLLLYCVSDQSEMYINVSPYLLKLNCWPVPTSKLQLQLILLLYCVSDWLEMYINISPYLLQLNSWPVPTSRATVTAIHTNHFCQNLYVSPTMIACSSGPHPRCQGNASSSSNRRAQGWRCVRDSVLQFHYYIWQTSTTNSCSLLRHNIVATVYRMPTRAAEWQPEMTNDSCQG